MIGIVWVNHHVLVKSITAVDRTLLFLNLVLLLFVVLIPFATATEADYFPANTWDARLAMTLYAGVFLGMSVGFAVIFEWTLHGQRVARPLPSEKHWAARARFVGGGLVYVCRHRGRPVQRRRRVRTDCAGGCVLHRGAHPGCSRRRGLGRRGACRLRSWQVRPPGK